MSLFSCNRNFQSYYKWAFGKSSSWPFAPWLAEQKAKEFNKKAALNSPRVLYKCLIWFEFLSGKRPDLHNFALTLVEFLAGERSDR